VVVKGLIIQVVLIKAGERAEKILEYLFGFELVEERKPSLVLFFSEVLFKGLLTVLFEDEGVRLIDEDEEVGCILNEFDVLLKLLVEFSSNIKLVSLVIVVVMGLK
jgi:hypothetical protein